MKPLKTCPKCRVTRPVEHYHKSSRAKDGLQKRCKKCQRSDRSRVYSKSNSREGHLLRRYGLTLDAFDALLEGQGGGCAICGKVTDDLVVDHDHATQSVRGILCRNCNAGIGQLQDDPFIVGRAARYLEGVS